MAITDNEVQQTFMKVRKQVVKTRNGNFSLSENQNGSSISPFQTNFNLEGSNSRLHTYHNRNNDSEVLTDIKNDSAMSENFPESRAI